MVFLHGLFGQDKNWAGIAKRIAERHRVHLIDLPHHGRSPWSSRFDLIETVEQVLGALPDDDPVALVGHSLGGGVAMALSLLHPQRVKQLVVVDISPVDHHTRREFADYVDAMQSMDLTQIARRAEADPLLAAGVPSAAVRSFKGRTETMEYTTTKVRDGLYVVRWTEPDAGDHVTHIEDYTNGTCMASSVIGGEFVQLHGTWTKVRWNTVR